MRRRLASTAAATAVAVLAGSLHVVQAPPVAAAATPTVSYTYDRLGRLKTVTDPTGASATYNYDPVGNLTGITRATAPARAARSAAPATSGSATSGSATAGSATAGSATAAATSKPPKITAVRWSGRTVTIEGRRFSPDPALDSVKVDGRFAKVRSATGGRLVVDLPPGAAPKTAVQVGTPGGRASTGKPRTVQPPPPVVRSETPTADGRAALTGRVLSTLGKPLAGVVLRLDEASTRTAADGRFTLTGLPAGHHELIIDATRIPAGDHGFFEQGVDLRAARTTTLGWTTYLPKIDNRHAVALPATVRKPMELRTPAIPGLRVIIPAGTRILDHDGRPVRRLSVTRMPLERQPFPGAPGMPLAWTIQPGGADIEGPGLQVVYPNVTHQPPGTGIDYVDNDPERPGQGWAVYGGGEVTADGTSIVPDAGTRLHETYPLGVSYNPPCLIPLFCPAPGEDTDDGDPVNLSTGLFMMSRTDLALPDVAPIALTRSYRQSDRVLRSFGIGQSDGFNLFVAPDRAGNYVVGLPDGRSVPFTPQPDGGYRAVTGPTEFTGAVLRSTSITNFQVTLRSGTVYTFGSHSAMLTAITDRYGNTTTLDRDFGSGQLQQVTSPNGRWLAFTYGACAGSGRCISAVTDNIGRSVRYTYDEAGRMTTAVDPRGGVTAYVWAPCSDDARCTQLTAVTDPLGVMYLRNTFDANGRVATQTQADGGVHRFAYTLAGSGAVTATSVTDPTGVTRRVTFNAAGYAVSDTAAAGTALQQTTTLTRDANNQVTASVDPTGRRTTFGYDADGNVLTSTDLAGTADASTTTFTYEPRYGRLTSAVDPLGRRTSFGYDDDNDTVTAVDPLGRRATTTILAGQPVSTTDALGRVSHISYLDGDPVAIVDPLGRLTSAYFDAAGRAVRRTDPLGNTVRLNYDVLNQLTRAVDPLGGTSTASYDANGNQLSLTDANNRTTRFGYDRMSRRTSRTDALGRVSGIGYDLLGRPVTGTDQKGTVTRAGYDALGRQTTTGYGATVSGTTTTFRSTVTTTYDTANRPTSIVDSTGGTLTQTYDTRDRLTRQTGPLGTVSYAYDRVDRRTSMTIAGQAPVIYAWDNADQLTSITQGTSVTRFGYDANSRRTSLTLPNGITVGYGWDAAGQLLNLAYTRSGATLGNLAYTYDAAGRRTTMSGSYARTSLPDALTGATYDAANQLTRLGAATFSYDANGQLVGDGAATYTWNDRHQLAGMAGPVAASFRYDALGRRIARNVGVTNTGYLYDGDNAVQELNGTAPTANMVMGPGVDETLQRTDATGVHHPLADALGSTLAQTSPAGATETSYTYQPFGRTTATGAASTNSSQFTGRENDGTGLYYYRARYYSPTAQRFISPDPAGEAASGANLYAYVDNSPTNYTDPSGEILLAGCVAGAVEGAAVAVGSDLLSGRKINWGGAAWDAAMGCVMGAGAGLLFKGFQAWKAGRAAKAAAKAAKSCNSFDAATPVVMADGTRKRIDQVRIGDRVRATDPETGRTVTRTVTRLFRHDDTDLTDVTVRDKRGRTAVVHTTNRHRFWDASRRVWAEAATLSAGTRLLTGAHGVATVVEVRSFAGVNVMHDLTVDDVHTYYVVAGRASVLVHNCGEEIYRAGGKHGSNAQNTSRGVNSAEPTNGQAALENSVQVKGTSPRRVGVDGDSGEIVVLDRTHVEACGCNGSGGTNNIWHGHVRSWEELHVDMQNALRRSGLVDRRGNIL